MNNKKQLIIWLTHDEIECFRFDELSLEVLKSALPNMKITLCKSATEFKNALPKAFAVAVWFFKQEWFSLAPNLRLLITPAAGKDYFKVSAPDNVKLHYCSFHGEIMAETVLAMMLATCRGVLPLAWMREGLWPRSELQHYMRPFHGSNVVIIGFGAIGSVIGRLAKALGARIIGIKKHLAPLPDYFASNDRVLLLGELDDILPETDHLVLCMPDVSETTNIIDAKRIALLPRHAWIYNVGRGNAINDDALASALISSQIAGACLDVYDEEPLPKDSVLRKAPNVLLMPHASSISPEYMGLFTDELIGLMKKNGAS